MKIMKLSALLLLLVVMSANAATKVQAVALFKDRAMLSVNGQKAKIIRAGSSYRGVKLISSDTSKAVIEVDGQRTTLKLNGATSILNKPLVSKPAQSYVDEVRLYVDENGFFQSGGRINGRSINFLVDTGANIVVINSVEANKIGLDYKQGVKSEASTASGVAPMYVVTADSMSIGDITLDKVKMGVIEGNFPEHPLLGMTFLSRLNMERKGDVMTLSKP